MNEDAQSGDQERAVKSVISKIPTGSCRRVGHTIKTADESKSENESEDVHCGVSVRQSAGQTHSLIDKTHTPFPLSERVLPLPSEAAI